jgi:hypothetical protein
MPETISLSLVSHTNVGKTTLARTLLGRDVGEVRDAPHVTEFTDEHVLLRAPGGEELTLWDTPGFGDSVRLVRRLRQSDNPLGWLLSQVWDRWRDRAFWSSQQVLRHVRERSDVLLYLVNAGEAPPTAGPVAAEMELLAWVGKPVLVLLNQMGPPREAAAEAAERQLWAEHLAPWPLVRAVLPMDAFARCWVQEGALWQAVHAALPAAQQPTMATLQAAWHAQRRQVFDAAMRALAQSLATAALHREPVGTGTGGAGAAGAAWRQIGSAVGAAIGATTGRRREADGPLAAAEQRLAVAIDTALRQGTNTLLQLHGLDGEAGSVVLERVAAQFQSQLKLAEGRAAWMGGLVSGALGGLAADLAAGGLTLGAGLIAGGLLGALGGAGAARGLNVVRGTHSSWVGLGDAALLPLVHAALLRYLAVAHFGRGRGHWAEGEAPSHWATVVDAALATEGPALQALMAQHRTATPKEPATAQASGGLADALQTVLARCANRTLAHLYPTAGAGTPE